MIDLLLPETRGAQGCGKAIPQRLKPKSLRALYGTAEAVPFQSKIFHHRDH
jgi:hypothetical protein